MHQPPIRRKVLAVIFFVFCSVLALRPYWPQKNPADKINTSEFSIQEISQKAGIQFNHKYISMDSFKNIGPWLSSQGASVAVVDINNDGWPDLYFNNSFVGEKNHLYINNHNGTFTESAAKYGLDDLNKSSIGTRALFFDCTNSGKQSLLLLTNTGPRILTPDKNNLYHDVDLKLGPKDSYLSLAANIIDLNGDGLLDIIISGYDNRGGGNPMPMNFVGSTNGAPSLILENKGNCQFEENKVLLPKSDTLFTTSIGAGRFTGANETSVWFTLDYNTDQVYTKKGEAFKFQNGILGNTTAKTAMSIEQVYFPNDSVPFVFVSHAYKDGYIPHGSIMWKYNGKIFEDLGREMGVNRCGFAWGSKFIDLKNDGHLDLYVANGFISGQPGKDYWYPLNVVFNIPGPLVGSGKNWPNMNGFNISGGEKDCLFYNDGTGYTDIASKFEKDVDPDNLNGRGSATIDFLNNGSQGLVVSNQKSHPYLYQIDHHNSNHWIGFKLVGTKSNRDAIGARIKLITEDNSFHIRENYPYNGYASQSDNRLHFGIGNNKKIKSVEITWPSGIVQNLKSWNIDQYNNVIEESL